MAARFPEHRFRAAGASRAQIKKAGEFWSAWDADQQAAFAEEMSSVSNDRVLEALEDLSEAEGTEYGTPDTVPQDQGDDAGDQGDEGDELDQALDTLATVEAHIADNPDDAAELLQRERTGKARKTVVAALEKHVPAQE